MPVHLQQSSCIFVFTILQSVVEFHVQGSFLGRFLHGLSENRTVAFTYFFSAMYGPHMPISDALTVVTSGTGVDATAHACMHLKTTLLSHERQTTWYLVGFAAY
jgi:hypothetical protein